MSTRTGRTWIAMALLMVMSSACCWFEPDAPPGTPLPDPPGSFGQFDGQVVARWALDGRDMELTQPVAFVDAAGVQWHAPAGAIVNGASIPQALWSLIGGPYEGLYRDASVLHDYECQTQQKPWRAVHRMFWYAARARGESQLRANLMYWAIMIAGTKWPAAREPLDINERDVLIARRHFQKNPGLTLDEIDGLELVQVRAMKLSNAARDRLRAQFNAERALMAQ